MKYYYNLIENTHENITMYGICLINDESKIILNYEDLTSDKKSVEKLIELCSTTNVTDTTLPYIIEDFII